MDLGTIKARLHSNSYTSVMEVVKDIRLVFRNAMTYNMRGTLVYEAAEWLLIWFEELLGGAGIGVSAEVFPPIGDGGGGGGDGGDGGAGGEPSAQPSVAAAAAAASQQSAGLLLPAVRPTSPPATASTAPATTAPAAPPAATTATTPPPPPPHSCDSCQGRTCPLCHQKCLTLEPSLLICNGSGCRGAKIRRGANFYAADDGTRQWCHRCYVGLPAVIPDEPDASGGASGGGGGAGGSGAVVHGRHTTYKRDLLKRRNDEEVEERWVDCTRCQRGMHEVCAMHDAIISYGNDFVCPLCTGCINGGGSSRDDDDAMGGSDDGVPIPMDCQPMHEDDDDEVRVRWDHTFVSGSENPTTMMRSSAMGRLDAKSLPSCAISSFVEKKVQQRMLQVGCPANAEKTLCVRVVSDCEKEFHVPDVIQRHFRMETVEEGGTTGSPSHDIGAAANSPNSTEPCERPKTLMRSSSSVGLGGTPFVSPPALIKYRSKAIALFQRIDGFDVCVFCMYVQEYDGDDEVDADSDVINQKKRVYIAYLDSVEHFRPRSCRTEVYHEVLVAYLATARARGYENAHIWACPPIRGNSFIFFSRPSSQKTPNRERLISWYNSGLSRGVEVGVINDVRSLYEHSFKKHDKSLVGMTASTKEEDETIMICPPLLDGDMWIDEAVRMYSATVSRHFKNRSSLARPGVSTSTNEDNNTAETGNALPLSSCCPAVQVADMLQRRILAHPSSAAFRRPVNASALKLKDYHDIITKPMDLGTVHSRILMGEYDTLGHLVSDVELVFRNAMRYNPAGHFIHLMAKEMNDLFLRELNKLARHWASIGVEDPRGHVGKGTPIEEGTSSSSWSHYRDMSMRLSTFLDVRKPVLEAKAESQPLSSVATTSSLLPIEAVDPVADSGTSGSEQETPRCIPEVIPPEFDPSHANSKPEEGACTEVRLEKEGLQASYFSSDTRTSTMKSEACEIDSVDDSSLKATTNTHIPCSPVRTVSGEKETDAAPAVPKQAKPESPMSRAELSPPALNLTSGGPDAIARRMVGEDYWLFDKKYTQNLKSKGKGKKKKRKAITVAKTDGGSSSKKRRESWLGDDVGAVIRKMRRDFFVCDLTSEGDGAERSQFAEYISGFDKSYVHGCTVRGQPTVTPGVADARHALLEFLQQRNLEFDSLRKAKHSTSVLLYYLHNTEDPGLVPLCSACNQDMLHIRWHQMKKVPAGEQQRPYRHVTTETKNSAPPQPGIVRAKNLRELCESCYANIERKENYIPIRISFERIRP